MFPVSDIYDEAKKIVGTSNDAFLFRRITDAVELLANKGDIDPLLGTLDICVSGQYVTLPREVETILGCNMLGQPAAARDSLYQFHLNGPGTCGRPVRYEWTDLADACVFRELTAPGKLLAYCDLAEDENAELWVYGYDQNQNVVRTNTETGWRDGYKVPVFSGVAALPADAPLFSRITAVKKDRTAGPLYLSALNDDGEVSLGVYQPDDEEPKFRRIKLSCAVPWVRIFFRRRTFKVNSKFDLLPMHNTQAVLMMLRALKHYDNPNSFAEAEACEATAVRWLMEEQSTRSPEVAHPIQVLDSAPIIDSDDHME